MSVKTAEEILANVKTKNKSVDVQKSVDLEYDLSKLFAFDPTEISNPSEEDLLKDARDNTQLLFKQLYNLPEVETKQRGLCIQLPSATFHLPREKPVPKEQELTKWEKFRRERGIKKRKRAKQEFDEDTRTWKRRFGKDKANDINNIPVIEFKEGDDPKIDPWTKAHEEKKDRAAWNKNKKDMNLKAAAGDRLPGTLDLASAIDASSKKKFLKKRNQERKKKGHVDQAIAIMQHSTVSMGKFDKKMKHEPKQRARKEKAKKSKMNFKQERSENLDVLSSILGRTSEKNVVNKNKLANLAQQKRNDKIKNARSKNANKKGKKGKR